MAAYLLNLTFGYQPASSAKGLFNKYNSADPAGAQSKAWYTVGPNWPSGGTPAGPGQVTQAAPLASWVPPQPIEDKGQPGFSCNIGDSIYIRVAPDSSWASPNPLPPNNLDGLVAAFGRPNGAQHDGDIIPSPFAVGASAGAGNGSVCAYFAMLTPPNGTIAPIAADNSWILYLGTTYQNAPNKGAGSCPNNKCTYAFIVGAGFWQGSNLWTFGHDPQMDVTG